MELVTTNVENVKQILTTVKLVEELTDKMTQFVLVLMDFSILGYLIVNNVTTNVVDVLKDLINV